jgi:cytochrome c peroxidase
MKTSHFLRALFLFSSAAAQAQLPAGSSLTISAGAAAGTGRVRLSDPGNHTWVLQRSTDLANWTNVEVLKVHNGAFHRNALPVPEAPGTFLRVAYDSAQQTAQSTLASALNLPASPYSYTTPVLIPSFSVNPIAAADTTPGTNPTTSAGAKLGRVLFYDKRLSLNQTVSCSSCHQAAHGFSDPRRFSAGFEGGLTSRNSMGLTNARWYQRRAFFWDERAATLEDQVLQPIQNAVEMGMTLAALEARLGAEPFFQSLFTEVFGSPEVTSARISRALAQFVRSIASARSKYDTGVAAGFSNFTAEENLGRQIFTSNNRGNCVACHGTDNFMPGNAINNNGLEFPFVDRGLGAVTGNAADDGKFKAGSLRNIELTAPYMHDGRFASLEEVVEFYNSGVVNNPNLSPPLRNPPGGPNGGQPRRLNLTAAEKAALVAFLKTLTDTTLTSDPKFSDPFNYGDQ